MRNWARTKIKKADGPVYVYKEGVHGQLHGVWVIRYRGYILRGDYPDRTMAMAEFVAVRSQGTRKPKGNRGS